MREEEMPESGRTENIAKRCPECNQPLTIRANRKTQQEFLGCTSWPECQYTESLPLDVTLRRQGHPELPGI